MSDGTDISIDSFDTPMRGICVICSQTRCGSGGGVTAKFKGHVVLEQIGARCADKIANARRPIAALAPRKRPTREAVA